LPRATARSLYHSPLRSGSDLAADSAAQRLGGNAKLIMLSMALRVTAKRPAGPLLGRDGWRAIVACLCLSPLLALAAHLTNESISSIFASRSGYAERQSGDDLKTGSILLVPLYGDRCRRLLIDNTTWFIADNGFIDCKVALAQARAQTGEQSSVRLGVIRNGFRKD